MTDNAGAVLWDMDGTLVDSEPLHEQALAGSLVAQGLTPPAELNSIVVGMSAVAIHALFVERFGLRLALDRWLELYYGLYLENAGDLRSRSGAMEVFRAVGAMGLPQVIVSNSDRMIVDANLRAAGISRPGLRSIARNDVRSGKPNPEPYLRAAWLVDLPPSRCVVVEDSVLGAAAGIAAGMRTLFWPQAELAAPEGAYLVASADELARALDIAANEHAF